MVSEKPFLPPAQQSTSQKPDVGVTGKKKKAATQPVEAPGVKKLATQPAEAPGAGAEIHPTSQAIVPPAGTSPSGRPEVQPPGPTTQPSTASDQPEDFASDDDQFTDNFDLSLDEEGELSEVLSQGPDCEELTDPDQELSSEQTYRDSPWC